MIVTITCCESDLGINPLGRTPDMTDWVEYKSMVIVQIMDSIRCSEARLKFSDGGNVYYYADNEGKIPIIYKHRDYYDNMCFQFMVYRDSTDTKKWYDYITLYKGKRYKEFYITFPILNTNN